MSQYSLWPDLIFSLTELNKSFKSNLLAGEKMSCPCCGRHAQVYRRKLHAGIALQMIRLYQKGGADGFLHFTKFASLGAGRDFTIARYWGLIERGVANDNETDEKKHSGFWKLTPAGVEFVLGARAVPKEVSIFDDIVLSASVEVVTIIDCLDDRFDYQELMQAC